MRPESQTSEPAPAGDPSPPPAEPTSLWMLLPILGLAVALRVPGFNESVWLDELYTSDIFCGSPIVLAKTLFTDIHPPVYFAFIHVWNGIFGDSEISLRTPPMLCGLLSIFLVCRIGEIFAGRAAGLAAAFLMAISPVHIWYSQEARPYSTSVCLLLLTLLGFYRLSQGRKGFLWTTLYFLALTGVVFTHYYMVTFAGVLGLFVLVRSNPARKRVLILNSIVIGMLGLYMLGKSYLSEVPTEMTYLRAFDLQEAWLLGFDWFLTGNTIDGAALIAVQVLGVALFARGAYRLLKRNRDASIPADAPPGADMVLHVMVLPVFLMGLTVAGLDKTYIERSALPALPLFVIVLGIGLTGWRHRLVGYAAVATTTAGFTFVLYAYFTSGDRWTVYKVNPDWRGAAAHLGQELDKVASENRATSMVHLYTDYVSPTALTYYDPRMQEVKHFKRNDAKIERLVGRIGGLFGTTSFPGAQIHDYAKTLVEDYLAFLDAQEAGMRLPILLLSRHDPLVKTAPAEFWFLHHQDRSDRATALLEDPRITVLEQRAFRTITLYKLRRSD